MRYRLPELRTAALLLVAALGVHQLRYVAGFGSRSSGALADHGHSYLAIVTPCLAVLAAFAVAKLLVRAAEGAAREKGMVSPLLVVWAAVTVALLALYSGQELLEGALTAHHPSGWEGVIGNGGWSAAPLSVVFGGLVALTLRAASAVEAGVLCRAGRSVAVLLTSPVVAPLLAAELVHPVRSSPLSRKLAGRAPPALLR